jgi:hypothetical protein
MEIIFLYRCISSENVSHEIVPYWKNFLAHLNHGIALIASYALAAHVHEGNWKKKRIDC